MNHNHHFLIGSGGEIFSLEALKSEVDAVVGWPVWLDPAALLYSARLDGVVRAPLISIATPSVPAGAQS